MVGRDSRSPSASRGGGGPAKRRRSPDDSSSASVPKRRTREEEEEEERARRSGGRPPNDGRNGAQRANPQQGGGQSGGGRAPQQGGGGGSGANGGGGNSQQTAARSARSAQLTSSISSAGSTAELLDLYASNMYALESRHVIQLWPRLAKRVHTESSRDTSRVAQWVSEHRAVVQQLLAHCLRVAFDAPQRDVAQVMLGAAYLCLRPERGQSTGPATLGRDLFDALPRLISFPMCRPPEIATILWALASCGVSTPALFSSAATAIGPHLQYTLEAAAANAATNGNGAAATSPGPTCEPRSRGRTWGRSNPPKSR